MRPLQLAERALIGSLLLNSADVRRLDWLRATDFLDAGCAAIYEHIADTVARGETPSAEEVLAQLREDPPEIHHDHIHPGRLAELITQAPLRAHPEIYARIVLEGSIHRQVEQLGVRVLATSDRSPQWILREAQQLAGASQVRLASAEVSGARLPETITAAKADLQGIDSHDSRAAECATVSALLYKPSQLPSIRTWLRPADFGSRDCRVAYRAMLDLDHDGAPIDTVTVAWQQQRYVGKRGQALTVEQLRHLASAGPIDAEQPGRTVLQASIQRQLRAVGSAMTHAARDATCDAADLLADVQQRLGAVADRHKANGVQHSLPPAQSAMRSRTPSSP